MYKPLTQKPQQQTTFPSALPQPPPAIPSAVVAPLPSHEIDSFKIEDSINIAKRKMKEKKKDYKKASKKSLVKRAYYKARSRCEKCGHKETGVDKKIVDGRCDQHRRLYEKAKREFESSEKMYHKTKSHKNLEFEYVIQKLTDNLNAAPIDMGDVQHELEMLQKLSMAITKQTFWKQQEANR